MARFRSRLPRCPADAGLIRSAARSPYGELPGYARLAIIGVPLTAARLTKRSTGRHCACSKTFGFLQARATGQLTVRSRCARPNGELRGAPRPISPTAR